MEGDEVTLHDNVVIRKIRPKEFEQISGIGHSPGFGFLPDFETIRLKYVIAISVKGKEFENIEEKRSRFLLSE